MTDTDIDRLEEIFDKLGEQEKAHRDLLLERSESLTNFINTQLEDVKTYNVNGCVSTAIGGPYDLKPWDHTSYPQPSIIPSIPTTTTQVSSWLEAELDIFAKIKELLEDLATDREFTDDLYDRFLSVKLLLEDHEQELALARTRVELIGDLLEQFKTAEVLGSGVDDPPMDG